MTPMGALRMRHSVLAARDHRPARARRCPAVGRLAVIDPETGRRMEIDTSSSRVRERFAEIEAERRAELAARAAPPARRPRRAVDRRRLAARARAEARDEVRQPRLAAAAVGDPARCSRSSGCAPARPPLRGALHRRLDAGAARRRGAAVAALAADGARAGRDRAARGDAGQAEPRGTACRSARRRSCSSPTTRARWRPTTSSRRVSQAAEKAANTFIDQLPKQAKVGVVAFSDPPDVVAGAVDRPRPRAHRDPRAVRRRRDRDRRRAAGRDQRCSSSSKVHVPSAIVLLSDGATTSGSDPIGRRAGRAQANIAIDTVALGKPGAVIPTPSRQRRRLARPRNAQADRQDLRRPGVHGVRRHPPELDLQEPRHAARHRDPPPQRLAPASRSPAWRCCSARG